MRTSIDETSIKYDDEISIKYDNETPIKYDNETPIKNIDFGIEFIIREMINDKSFKGWD